MWCEATEKCRARGEKRSCGHFACDGCTDDATNLCLFCVPVDEELFQKAVLRYQEAVEMEKMQRRAS